LEEKVDSPIEVHDISADFEVASEETDKVIIKASAPKHIMASTKIEPKSEVITDFDELD
jgi:hypothetical protein